MCTVLGRSGPLSPMYTTTTFSTATPEHSYARAGPPTLGTQGLKGTCSTVAWNKVAQGTVEQEHSCWSWQQQAARDKPAHPHRLS